MTGRRIAILIGAWFVLALVASAVIEVVMGRPHPPLANLIGFVAVVPFAVRWARQR